MHSLNTDHRIVLCTSYELKSVCQSFLFRIQFVNWIAWIQFFASSLSTYLLFQTLFLLFYPLTCMICIELTWTNVVFSRITLGVYFCAEINFPRKFPEIHQNSIFTEDPQSPKDNWRGATGLPEGGQARPPLATPGGPLGAQSHLSGSPSVFRSLRPRNGEPPKDFPKYDTELRQHEKP